MNRSPSRWPAALVGLALLAVGGGGCSWTFMQPLPADAPPERAPDCSTNWLAKMDGILAGAFAANSAASVGGYYLIRDEDTWMPWPKAYLVAGGAYAVPALIFAASAITGALWARRCDEQYLAYRQWAEKPGHEIEAGAPPGEGAGVRTVLRDGRACPAGAHVRGAPPPVGFEVGCVRDGPDGQPVAHGPAATWYESGARASAGEYEDGQRHGRWQYWYPDGTRKLEAHYDHGRQVGRWIFWDQAGEIFKQTDFGPIPGSP